MTIPDELRQELYLIADEMRGIASIAKMFAENMYESERSEKVMELAAKLASVADESSIETVKAIFAAEPWLRLSPAIGCDTVVLNKTGNILLIQRQDNAHWCLPGGLAEIGQTLPEAALRELWEEAGLRGRVSRLLGIFDSRLWGGNAKVHLMMMTFLVECDDLAPDPGLESKDAQFFAPDNLPTPLHGGYPRRLPKILELVKTGETYFDPSDSTNAVLSMNQRPIR